MLIYLSVFILAFLAAYGLTPLAGRLARRLNLVSIPGGRRQHSGMIPKLGGVPLFAAFLLGCGLIYLWQPPQGNDALLLPGVMLGSVVALVGGLLDDLVDLPWWAQLIIQGVATAVAVNFQVIFEVFTNPLSDSVINLNQFTWGWLVVPLLTFLWISGMINTVNLLDGLDGLAAGVALIAAVFFAIHSYTLEQYTVSLFPLALAGALLGFLPHNFNPARIYLGGTGPYFLGFALATLAIISPAKIATALLVMAVPIMDVGWQIIDRLRRGQNPFQGDRGHLHFRLSDGGLPVRRIVVGYYVVALAFGLVAIYAPGLWKLILLIGLGMGVSILLAWLGQRSRRLAAVDSQKVDGA